MEACQKRGVATPTWSINGDFVVETFMRPTNGDTQSDTQDDAQSDTQDDTQGDTQDDTQDGTQDGTQGVAKDVTQGVTQGVPHDVPQNVPQDEELDGWIEKQIRNNPQVSTEDLAKLSNRSSRTTKRHLVKMPHIRYVGSGYSGHWKVLYSLLQTRLD